MPDIFGELARDWRRAEHAVAEHLPHHHPASAAQAAAAPTIATDPQEAPVNLGEIKTDIATVAAKLEAFDEAAFAKLEAVRATPEGAAAFDALHAVVSAAVPAPVLSIAESIIRALVPAPAPAPAGPQVAGQA